MVGSELKTLLKQSALVFGMWLSQVAVNESFAQSSDPTNTVTESVPSSDETSPETKTQEQSAVVRGVVAPGRRISLPARVATVVSELQVKIGQRVTTGERLLQFETVDALQQVAEARASLEIAQARLEGSFAAIEKSRLAVQLAEADLERAIKSRERVADSVTDAEIERRETLVAQSKIEQSIAESNRHSSEGEVALARSKFDTAQLNLARHELLAPFDGVVTRVAIQTGEWGVVGATMIEMSDDQNLMIDTFLPEECTLVAPDSIRATVINEAGEALGTASVVLIAPELDPAHHRAAARLAIEPNSDLQVGKQVSIQLSWSAPKAEE